MPPYLPGLEAFPLIPGPLLVDVMRVARRAAQTVPAVRPATDHRVGLLKNALAPLASALQSEIGGDQEPFAVGMGALVLEVEDGAEEPASEERAVTSRAQDPLLELLMTGLLAGVPESYRDAARSELEQTFRLAAPPHARDQRTRFYALYVTYWNEATNVATGTRGRKEKRAATRLGRVRLTKMYAELQAAFDLEDAAEDADRFISIPRRDELALRFLAYSHVLRVEQATAETGKLAVYVPLSLNIKAVRASETADVLARALAREVDDSGALSQEKIRELVARRFPSRRDFENWAVDEVKTAKRVNQVLETGDFNPGGGENQNDDTVRAALREAAIISDRDSKGRRPGEGVLPVALRLLDRAKGSGWLRAGTGGPPSP